MPRADPQQQPLAIHPTLRSYYATDAQRQSFVSGLFDRAASHYDWLDRVLSFGSGPWYRTQVLQRAGVGKGMSVLDVATGTGPVAATARRMVGDEGLVVGADPSRGMLNVAQQKGGAHFVQSVGEALAIRSEAFDVLVMGYALRHVGDLREAFREYHRVLKTGGRVVIMELCVPRSGLGAWLLRGYMGTIVPLIARFGTRSRDAERLMQYYWATTESCVAPEVILDTLREAGFRDVRRYVKFGFLTEYAGIR